jgi:hypothetical protein
MKGRDCVHEEQEEQKYTANRKAKFPLSHIAVVDGWWEYEDPSDEVRDG